MKRLLPLLILCAFSAAALAQQSLGDVARKNRTKKTGTSAVKLDDDNMQRTLTAPPDEDQAAARPQSNTPPSTAAKKASANAKDSWTDKIESQKKEVATIGRELDILQREQRLRAAAYYADAGVMLRDQTKFAEDSRKEQEQIDAKKQALDAAQQKLDDLQEQARKAGVPAAAAE